MTSLDDQTKLKQELVLLTDAYIKLSDNPTWQELATQYPELENARHAAVAASDNVWWQFRTKLNVQEV